MVDLGVVPHEQQHLVVVGSVVRKPANIVRAWLDSIAWQVKPKQVQILYLFIDDGCAPEARKMLDLFVADRGGFVWDSGAANQPDFSDLGDTHQWTASAMQRVGACKDRILKFCRDNRAEAAWLLDADLIVDPMTLSSLWSIPEQICAAVFWTRWNKVPEGFPPLHAGPQVWQGHPYQLAGNGMEEWELRKKLLDRDLVHVYGQGACTLIRREALLRGVSFAPWPGNDGPGLMQGEDRHFCIRAAALHIKMVADGWPDIFHIYHRPEDEALIPEMTLRLGRGRHSPEYEDALDGKPEIGDLVSLELHAMEPVQTQSGPQSVPTQYVRGRLGGLIGGKTLHPELESAILEMQRGQVRIVPVHFSDAYPFPPHRGQRKLIRVTLIDHKPFGFPPVVEDEVLRNPHGSWIDTTTCTPELLDQMREVHA